MQMMKHSELFRTRLEVGSMNKARLSAQGSLGLTQVHSTQRSTSEIFGLPLRLRCSGVPRYSSDAS